MFKQVEIPGKGQGLVATAKLPVGTIIVTDTPLITVENIADETGGDTHSLAVWEIAAEFRRLPDEQKIQVLSLHDPDSDWEESKLSSVTGILDKVVRIFISNSIELCSHKEMNVTKSGLYCTISRINHSCAPNVVWSWLQDDESRSVKQVRVCREIMEGEEILANYCGSTDTFLSKGERQRMLLKNWKFICNCDVCSLTGEKLNENEEARKKIRELHAAIFIKGRLEYKQEALEAAKEKLRVMKTIKKEMIVAIPDALMTCCELTAYCNLPSSNATQLMRKANDMSELFGDLFVHDYYKVEKRIARIGK